MLRFVLALVVLVGVADLIAADPVSVKWCYINSKAKGKCEAMETALQAAARKLGLNIQASCIDGKSAMGCMSKIKNKEADLVVLKDLDIYDAGMDHNLGVIMMEKYMVEACYAVAVVKNSSSFNFNSQQGKNACFPGARSGPGLVIPLGYMMLRKLITPLNCSTFEKVRGFVSAANYFSQSCVPGVAEFNTSGNIPSNLCQACKSDCSTSDEYSGYEGAFKCMADGKGDVAFVTDTTTKQVVDKGQHGQLSDYKYLCPNGKRAAIGSHLDERCFVDNCPAAAIMTRYFDQNEANYADLMMKLSDMYGVNQTDPAQFQLFNSTKYGEADLLFSDSAIGLIKSSKKFFHDYLADQRFADKADEVTCGKAPPKPTQAQTTPGPTTTSDGFSLSAHVTLSVAMATLALLK